MQKLSEVQLMYKGPHMRKAIDGTLKWEGVNLVFIYNGGTIYNPTLNNLYLKEESRDN